MQSINSLKQRPAFNKTRLPNRSSIEPSNSEQPPNKKRIFFDRINESESDDDSVSSNRTAKKGGNTTLRFFLKSKNQASSKTIKQALPINSEFSSNGKKKRESISTLFNQSIKKEVRTPTNMQFYINLIEYSSRSPKIKKKARFTLRQHSHHHQKV